MPRVEKRQVDGLQASWLFQNPDLGYSVRTFTERIDEENRANCVFNENA
jgi:hypothetical protein